jgi:NADH dehydrogenase FAD-containing subunit
MMSLGSASGAVTLPIPVPPPLSAAAQASGPLAQLLRAAGVRLSGSYGGSSEGVTLEGPLAAALRRAAYLYRQPTLEQQLRVAGGWAQAASRQLRDTLAQAAGR